MSNGGLAANNCDRSHIAASSLLVFQAIVGDWSSGELLEHELVEMDRALFDGLASRSGLRIADVSAVD